MISEKVRWKIADAFFAEHGLLSMQLESYNDFVTCKAQKILKSLSHVEIRQDSYHKEKVKVGNPKIRIEDDPIEEGYKVDFGELFFNKPVIIETNDTKRDLFPVEAMERNISYTSEAYADVTVTLPNGSQSFYEKQSMGTIPVMVKSVLCNTYGLANDETLIAKGEDPKDFGGYFIVIPKKDGSYSSKEETKGVAQRRIIVSQERIAPNEVFVFRNRKSKPRFEVYAECHSAQHDSFHTSITTVGIRSAFKSLSRHMDPKSISVCLPRMDGELPFMTLLCALGKTDPDEVMKEILEGEEKSDEKELLLSFAIVDPVDQSAALDLIGKMGKRMLEDEEDVEIVNDLASVQATKILTNDFLPHIENMSDKADHLIYLLKRILRVYTREDNDDDRDHYANKRVVATGSLLAQQFYGALRKMIADMVTNVRKLLVKEHAINVVSWMTPSIVTNCMTSALTGNQWRFGGPKSKGIAQLYEQYNITCSLTNARKLSVPMDTDGGSKVVEPRDLHPSHEEIVCMSETPEGKKAGLVKMLALTGKISIGSDPYPVSVIVKEIVGKEEQSFIKSQSLVILNGVIITQTKNPKKLIKEIISMRRSGSIDPYLSISMRKNDVRINTDSGRSYRPLLVLKNMKKYIFGMNWSELMINGIVEMIDKAEEEGLEVNEKSTHSNIHPAFVFGVGASIIPFASHNQAPRLTYQASMGKQAVGIPFGNFRTLNSGTFQVSQHVQRPICSSRTNKYTMFDEMPSGLNAMTAIMPRPFNEEDSIEINQSSIERGFMVSYKYVCHYADFRDGEKIEIPRDADKKKKCNYSKLGANGVIVKGQNVSKGDVLISKTILVQGKNISRPILYDHEWPAIVDKIQHGTTGDGYSYIRIMTVQRREPVVGDKFSSRFSQKGVLGIKVREEDLPFDSNGIRPDMIVNSLAFPSRMTIGKLIEIWTGKVISSPILSITLEKFLETKFAKTFVREEDGLIDGTPFRDYDIKEIVREASTYGITLGDEQLTDGITGEPLRCLVMFGPCYYQRLRHQVIDKIHARAKGGKTAICRQPREGRLVGGGLKIGYMEKDCMFGQGATRLVKDRLMEQSDKFKMYVCDNCGLQAYIDAEGREECRVCESNRLSRIAIPYGTKLTIQELMAMNIVPRILNAD